MENLIQLEDSIIDEFCGLVGIKKVRAFVRNNDTNEIRYYSYPSGAYKKPKGWSNVTQCVLSKAVYPDLLSPCNFVKLLNVQWNIFGSLGPQYTKINNECFEVNYIANKIQGIKVCKSFGGGELLNDYIKAVKETDFDYELDNVEIIE